MDENMDLGDLAEYVQSGFTEEELAERRQEEAEILKSIPYDQIKPPAVSTRAMLVVYCHSAQCGIIGLRDTDESAGELSRQHRAWHLAQNKKAAVLLARFREENGDTPPASQPQDEVEEVNEVHGLQLDMRQTSPTREVLEQIPDNGYLDWQWGSEASGRDPDKMWHRMCGKEVTIVNGVRVCECGAADTKDGRVSLVTS